MKRYFSRSLLYTSYTTTRWRLGHYTTTTIIRHIITRIIIIKNIWKYKNVFFFFLKFRRNTSYNEYKLYIFNIISPCLCIVYGGKETAQFYYGGFFFSRKIVILIFSFVLIRIRVSMILILLNTHIEHCLFYVLSVERYMPIV